MFPTPTTMSPGCTMMPPTRTGTCEATVLEGEVEHRDFVLSPEERAEQRRMMVCVSRCGGGARGYTDFPTLAEAG